MGLGEVLRLRYAEDSGLPKRLGFVVAIESLTGIFGLADVDDWLGTVFIFTEQKVNAWVIEFPTLLA